jgi:hypothetical protein
MSLRFNEKIKDQTTLNLRLLIADELAKLAKLKAQNMITTEEFVRMKEDIENL